MSGFLDLNMQKRLQIEYLLNPSLSVDDGQDVIFGLNQSPKSLPPHYFYDGQGSQLFEQICQLPEYYPTRTEEGILQKYAVDIARLTGVSQLIELGSGSSLKTRQLLDAYQVLGYPLRYVPIDVSASIVEESSRTLLQDYPQLDIYAMVATYELALEKLIASDLPTRMMIFLGSTLGNFSQKECDLFFSQVTHALKKGNYFLLGIDLQKPIAILEAAYNDSQGITAAFNLNMLAHLNWRFDGNFALNLFEHQAIYNESKSQIEMYLIAKKAHSVFLKGLDLNIDFSEGEKILTEISRKFNLQQMSDYLRKQGLNPLQIWTDANQWFSLLLCQM